MQKALARVAVVMLAGSLSDGAIASAQTGTGTPTRAIFGPSDVQPGKQAFDVTVNVAEAFDQNLSADLGSAPASPFQTTGLYTNLAPALDFVSRGEKLTVVLKGGSNFRYYGDLHSIVATSQYVGGGFVARISPRTSFSLDESVTRTPPYLYGLFARPALPTVGDVIIPTPSYAVTNEHSYTNATSVDLTQKISSRAAFSLKSDVSYTTFVGAADVSDLHTINAGGRFTYSISRDVSLGLGYIYRQAHYTGQLRPIAQDIDVGLEYSRPLSRTRRTNIHVSIGPTIVSGLQTQLAGEVRPHPYVLADALLDHSIGQTWHARAGYHRGLAYLSGAQSPLYTQGITSETTGFLNRRTDLSMSAAYSLGESAVSSVGEPLSTYTGRARARVAIARELAVYLEYLYYRYSLDPRIQLTPNVPHHLTRNGIQAGFTLWLPLRHR